MLPCRTRSYFLQPKPAPSAAAPSQAPSTPSRAAPTTPAAPPAPAPSTATSAAPAPATPSPAAGGAQPSADAPAFNDPSALLAGAQSEPVIAQMESMGFARADINRAMRAAFFNPDRAIEYLLSVSIVFISAGFSFVPRLINNREFQRTFNRKSSNNSRSSSSSSSSSKLRPPHLLPPARLVRQLQVVMSL